MKLDGSSNLYIHIPGTRRYVDTGHTVDDYDKLEAENQKLRDANRWIPVSDRLPAQKAYYYCEVIDSTSVSRWYGALYVMQQWWNGSDWNTPESAEVIAWRELPEPYQGDK